MAQISEEHVVIKISQLVRDGESANTKLSDEIVDSLEQVVSELVGDGCVVEITKG